MAAFRAAKTKISASYSVRQWLSNLVQIGGTTNGRSAVSGEVFRARASLAVCSEVEAKQRFAEQTCLFKREHT